MPSPAISRLDAAKPRSMSMTSAAGYGTANTNVTTGTHLAENAVAQAVSNTTHGGTAVPSSSSVSQAASVIEGAKKLAAYAAVDHHVLRHHKVGTCHLSRRFLSLMDARSLALDLVRNHCEVIK